VSRTLARAIAGAVIAACLVSVVVSIPVSLAARDRIRPGQIVVVGDPSTPRTKEVLGEVRAERAAGNTLEETTGQFNAGFAVVISLLLIWMGVGFLIVSRQPTNWAGWLFIITGAPFPLLTLGQALVIYGVKADPGSVPLVGIWAVIGEYALYPLALLPLLFLLYPDGHLPSPRWRWAVAGLMGGTAVAFLGFLFRPGPFNNWIGDGVLYMNPLGIDGFAEAGPVVILIGTVVALLSALSTLVAVRQRFKRSHGDERQRMRWLAFVASLSGTLFALMWVLGLGAFLFSRDGDAPIFPILFGLTALSLVIGIPASYLVAIFRYGLWDLDVVVKKAVVALLVAVFLSLVAVVAASAVGFLAISGGDVTNAAIVGVVLGLLVVPILRLARRLANRVVYGRRATPYEVLTEFSGHVGSTYSSEDVLSRMAQILSEATGASVARIWLRLGAELRQEASWPADAPPVTPVAMKGDSIASIGGAHAVEVRHQGELLGALTAEMPSNDPMNPSKEKLIGDLASQAGLVLRNVRLIEELRASRQRLVAAQDGERRKIERDIHDGAQQQLVALAVQLKLLQGLIQGDSAKALRLAETLQAATNEALEDLRDLARGIYPPLLADKGLAAALESQARRSPVAVTVEPDGVGRYSQDVESAVYFCCLEALNNVAKYAAASAVTMSLAQDAGRLSFRIVDDGQGFDPAAIGYGTGLQGMADRLDAIGGELNVESAPGRGTTVVGRVPLASDKEAGR
jgi:signal transduction histidine kinase